MSLHCSNSKNMTYCIVADLLATSRIHRQFWLKCETSRTEEVTWHKLDTYDSMSSSWSLGSAFAAAWESMNTGIYLSPSKVEGKKVIKLSLRTYTTITLITTTLCVSLGVVSWCKTYRWFVSRTKNHSGDFQVTLEMTKDFVTGFHTANGRERVVDMHGYCTYCRCFSTTRPLGFSFLLLLRPKKDIKIAVEDCSVSVIMT